MFFDLLATKLYPPPVQPGYVIRERLLDLLQDGLNRGRRLTLVSAPAGYGKTTLVSSWFSRASFEKSWISLDPSDNDPVRFLVYVVSALRSIQPELGEATLGLLGGPQLPPVNLLMTTFINELSDLKKPSVLVLDDYHQIRNPFIHDALQFILDYLPVQPTGGHTGLHLVILSREDPPLPLPRLRVRNQITEVRPKDLRFSQAEADEFFRGQLGWSLQPEWLAVLDQRTEGWIAGLQLAALSIQGLDSPGEFIQAFRGSHQYVIDYLLEEVLKRQSPEMRDFLRATAVLDRFSAALCDAVSGQVNSRDCLSTLMQSNLFLIPLDDQRQWFRYHHLFADFLRTELTPEQKVSYHQRAAAWYANNNYLDDAIQHALAGKDMHHASLWIQQAAKSRLMRGELTTIYQWISELKEENILQDVGLCFLKAFTQFMIGDIAGGAALVQQLQARIESSGEELPGWAYALQTWIGVVRNEPGMLAQAEKSLAVLASDDSFLKMITLIPYGSLLFNNQRLAESTAAFQQAFDIGRSQNHLFGLMGALANLSFNWLEQGKRKEALAACDEALQKYVDRHGEPLAVSRLLYIPLAVIYYEGGDTELAERYAEFGLEASQKLFSGLMMGGDSETILAKVYFERGEVDKAFDVLRATRQAALQADAQHVLWRVNFTEADLNLRQKAYAPVEDWLRKYDVLGSKPRDGGGKVFSIYAGWLIGLGRLDEAEDLLNQMRTSCENSGRIWDLLRIEVLLASLYEQTNRHSLAIETLGRAVTIAAPEGFKKIFQVEGESILAILPECQHFAPQFIVSLVGDGDRDQAGAVSLVNGKLHGQVNGLVEPLHERELEILNLLSNGLSNQEIADQLYLGLSTIKWHLNNIYGKMGVKSRTQAIARAKELGLLP